MTRLLVLGQPAEPGSAAATAYFASIGLAMTAVLVGIRTWRRLTTPTDETGD